MRKLLIQFLIISLVSNTCYADVVYLERGAETPFSGFLFDDKAGKDIKTKLVDLQYFEKLSISLKLQVDLYESMEGKNNQKYEILLEQNNKLAKAVHSERSLNDFERFLWLGSGAIITVLILYGLKNASK